MMRHLIYCLLLCSCLTAVAQVGELPRSTPEAEGVDPALLNKFYHDLTASPRVDVHHLMVLRHGKVIGELHASPYKAEHLHTLYSASKTVTALAVGLAIEDGHLMVDDKVSKYLRDKMPAMLSPALDSLTVRNMLMMAAGREADLTIPEGDVDWLTAWFAGDFSGVGNRFIYDSMCTHALAMIVTRVMGRPVLDYVKERIFEPLHITEADWELAPDSVEAAGWGLRMHTESEAKLGLLLLNNGKWNGRQLVNSEWIHDMTSPHISTEAPKPALPFWQRIVAFFRRLWHTIRSWFTGYNVDDYYLGYGYQTKAIQHPRAEAFFAAGYGGQLIYVVPKLDMVIVINGRAANYGDELNTIYYRLIDPIVAGREVTTVTDSVTLSIDLPRGAATHLLEDRLLNQVVALDSNLLGIETIRIAASGDDRIFTMTDKRGPLRAVAAYGQWRFTTGDERPIYIMESREQLVGTRRPFTTIAAYAWQGDTLAMRMDWLDGGDNRRLWMTVDGDDVTVIANDNFDPLLNDTIRGRLVIRD
jgi:CubicO group peptidase (beta-lactamase class C family)